MKKEKAKVFVHVGHGGNDPGAIGNGMRESDVVLDVALRLETMLKHQGIEVMLSRRTDVNVGNSAPRANAWGADMFLDLHCNAFYRNTANGYETFYPANKPQDKAFAACIHAEYLKGIPNIRDRGVKPDGQTQHSGGIRRLRDTLMPACLAEFAFITADATRFPNPGILRDHRGAIASVLLNGILRWMQQVHTTCNVVNCPEDETAYTLVAEGAHDGMMAQFRINGNDMSFPGIIRDNRTLVHVRGIFEHLGFSVDWDGNTRTVTIRNAAHTIQMTIGSDIFDVNGIIHRLDVPAQLVEGMTMIPIRLPLEAVGFTVDWLEDTRTVTVDG
jgi:N-acetylmuramoyl-L-alanine amidase